MSRCGILSLVFIVLFNFNPAFAEPGTPWELEPISITKSKAHLLNSYTLESDSINNSPFGSWIEALSILPLDLQSRTAKADIQTDFSLRGSSFQGVSLVMDGQRINDPQTAHHNCDIPLTKEDIERIDVLGGISSALFGPDAIGGVINIITKKPETKKTVLELSGGQHGIKSGLISISDKIDNLGVRFSLDRQESEGFRYDTDFKKFTTRIDSFLDTSQGEFNLGLGYQEKEFGAYDFYTPNLGYPSKEWTKTVLINTGLRLDKGDFIIKPNFLWRRHYDKFMLDKTQKRSTYLNHHRTDIFTPNIYFQKENDIFGNLGLGLEYGQERISSTSLGKHTRGHKSIFMDTDKELNSHLSLGLSLRSDDFDGFNQVYTGSLNLHFLYSLAQSFSLGLARSVRVPSFTELYYNDPTTGGDSSLSAEKSLNYQIGYDYKREIFSAGLIYFFREEDDMIDWIKRTPYQAKWQAENITEDEVLGLESYFKVKINPHIHFDTSYTYINKSIDSKGYLYKYGPNYAKHLVNNTLKFNLPFGVQTISAIYKKKPGRRGWFLLDAYLSYNLNKNFHIFSRATNLLNVEYQEIEGIPQPGRWIEAGLRLEW
jgi:iron complex outermembrane receptor protein